MAAFCQLQRNFLNWLQTTTVCVLTGLNNMRMQCEKQLWIVLSKTKRLLFPWEPSWKATVDITTKALLLVHYLQCASSYPLSFLFKVKSTIRGSQLHSVTTIIFSLWQYTKSCVVKPLACSEAIANHMTQFALCLFRWHRDSTLQTEEHLILSFFPFFFASPSSSSYYFFFSSCLHPPPCSLMPVQTSSLRFSLNLPATPRRNILTLLIDFKDEDSCTSFLFLDIFNCSSFHSAVCLMTGLQPLPKRALHTVRSRALSFK